MDIEHTPEGLAEVRFVGGFLHGRTTLMAQPAFRMQMESPTGEPFCYCRRLVESAVVDGRNVTVATYAPEGVTDYEFERLVIDAARNGARASLD